MIIYNAWHLLSRFNNLYAVSTKDNIARLICQKNINYYGRKTVTFMCIKMVRYIVITNYWYYRL